MSKGTCSLVNKNRMEIIPETCLRGRFISIGKRATRGCQLVFLHVGGVLFFVLFASEAVPVQSGFPLRAEANVCQLPAVQRAFNDLLQVRKRTGEIHLA